MAISLGNALLSIKEDENWIKKTIIGGLIYIPIIIASYVMSMNTYSDTTRLFGLGIYLIIGSLFSGFILATVNKIMNSDSKGMAEWTDKNLMLKGLKFIFSYFLYMVVFYILFTLISFVAILITTIILGLIYFLVVMLFHIDCNSLSSNFLSYFMSLILITVIILLSLWVLQLFNAAFTCYYKTLRLKDFMAFKKHFRIVKENKHAAWTLIGKGILLGLLALLVFIVLCITIIGIIAIPFVSFLFCIACANLYAQYGKEVQIERYLEE